MKNLVLFHKTTYLSVFTILLVFIGWLLMFRWRRRRIYEFAKQLHGPKPLPVIGNALILLSRKPKELMNEFLKLAEEYPPPFVFWVGPLLHCIIAKPEDLQILLNSPSFLNKSYIYQFATSILGQGLLTAPAPVWKKTRKAIGPFFNNKNMNELAEQFGKGANVWIEEAMIKIVGKGTVDVLELLRNYSYSTIFEITLGVKLNAEDIENLEDLTKKLIALLNERMNKVWLLPQFAFDLSPQGREFKKIETIYHNFIQKIISTRWKMLNRSNDIVEIDAQEETERRTYIDHLYDMSKKYEIFDELHVRHEVNTIIHTGYDTTTHTLGFIILMLAIHQDVQQRVYEEVIAVLGSNRSVQASDLPQFEYLDRVIKETLRIYPSAALLNHNVEADIKLTTLTLPSDTCVMVAPFYVHRNEKYWPDPLRFDPDRFLPDEIKKRHPYTYIPFWAGPRNCVGQRYAMVSMKTLIAMVVRKFKIQSQYKSVEEIELISDVIILPKNGVKVSLEVRK